LSESVALNNYSEAESRLLAVNVVKSFGVFALEASFELAGPGVTVVFGPSGAGKTTLLSLLAGLGRPDSGFIRYQGRTLFDSAKGVCLAPEKRSFGYVFQEPRLFSHFSVTNNLLFATRFGGRVFDRDCFERVVDLLGLGSLLSRRPRTLSGGESQRVAIGRALLAQGDLLLMDEPLSSLDRERKNELLSYIIQIPARFGSPIIYVTHAEDELLFLADRVLEVKDGHCVLRDKADFLNSREKFAALTNHLAS
jgi:molybdate transport system ATP-binding protein